MLLCGCALPGEAALLCGGESALLDAGARPCDVEDALNGAWADPVAPCLACSWNSCMPEARVAGKVNILPLLAIHI